MVPNNQIKLPDVIILRLPAQHAIEILSALNNYGPYKVVQPVLQNIEQQIMSQQVKTGFEGPPPAPPTQPVGEVPAAVELPPEPNAAL